MKRASILLILTQFVASCAELPVSQSALCQGTKQERIDHATALLSDGGPTSQATGADLLGKFGRGCGEIE